MAESKGCALALRRVTRGAAVSTSSAEFPLSNMRDCVTMSGRRACQRKPARFYMGGSSKRNSKKNSKSGGKRHAPRANFELDPLRLRSLLLRAASGGGVGVFLGEPLYAA